MVHENYKTMKISTLIKLLIEKLADNGDVWVVGSNTDDGTPDAITEIRYIDDECIQLY